MTRVRVFIVFVLAIAAGGVFAFGTYNYVQKLPVKAVTMATKQVVVAGNDLDIGAEISRDDIRVIDWPTSAVPANAISNPQEVIGRGIIMPMIQNEPFLPIIGEERGRRRVAANHPARVPGGLGEGERSGRRGGIRAARHARRRGRDHQPDAAAADVTSKVVLTNVQVLTAGTKIEQDGDKGKPTSVSVVTLLVDPSEAERLTLASTEGKIQLALRNPLDTATPVTQRASGPPCLLGAACEDAAASGAREAPSSSAAASSAAGPHG